MILGVHAANIGGKLPFVEKVSENLSITTKNAAEIMPTARCNPLPPLVLRDAITAPIMVRMNTDIGLASRRYRSTL